MRWMAAGMRSGMTLALTALCIVAASARCAQAAHVYGRIERALVQVSPSIQVWSQLEGGGDATVLYVTDLKYASGEDGMVAQFTIADGAVVTGKSVSLTLPVVKDQLVHESDGSTAHHPVVALNLCIGSVAFSSNVTLAPRTGYTPPLVLGKSDAARFAPIDPRKKYTGDPDCQAAAVPVVKH